MGKQRGLHLGLAMETARGKDQIDSSISKSTENVSFKRTHQCCIFSVSVLPMSGRKGKLGLGGEGRRKFI